MPVVVIYGNDGISVDDRRKMVEEVTDSVSSAYGLPKEAITILVEGLSKDCIGVAGELLSEKK